MAMSEPGTDELESTITEFVELERELDAGGETTAESVPTGQPYDGGTITGATTVPTDEVPEGYPVPINTTRALRLDVSVEGGRTVPTYQEWPDEDRRSDHVERILDALGKEPSEFADIYGEDVALDTANGWYGIDVDATEKRSRVQYARGDESLDTTRNLLAATVAFGGASLLALPFFSSAAGVGLLLTWIAIPVLVYLDANSISKSTEWEPNTQLWALGGLIPVLNSPIGAAYLVNRRAHLSGTAANASKVCYRSLLGGVFLSVVGIAATILGVSIGSALFLLGWLFLPFGVYLDAVNAREATNGAWDPSEELWGVLSFVFSIVGAGAYLLVRRTNVD